MPMNGGTAAPGSASRMQPITIEPIAVFRSPFGSKFGVPRQSGLVKNLRGELHFLPGYRIPAALKGLDGFRFLWLIWGFSGNARRGAAESETQQTQKHWSPTVRPPRLGGNAGMGVFATRSPFRPNELGLSAVELERIDREALILHVLGADLMDGTPVYDIKPYLEYADSRPGAGNGFVDQTDWPALEVKFAESAVVQLRQESAFTDADLDALKAVLALDPRPRCQHCADRLYGFPFRGMDIRFKVQGGVLTVIEAAEAESAAGSGTNAASLTSTASSSSTSDD